MNQKVQLDILPSSLRAIQNKLSTDQVLIEYHWGDQDLFVFLLRADTFILEKIPDSKFILHHIKNLFQTISERQDWLGADLQPKMEQLMLDASNELYCMLIRPFEWALAA